MEAQKNGLDSEKKKAIPTTANDGWLYIKLPQSIYLTSPQSDRYYFGYSDPRFKYFSTQEYSFQDVCTYGFLGFGEFRKTQDGLWSNNNFSVPHSILDMLIESTMEIRQEQFDVWKNLFRRDPELVREISLLKSTFPYTKDGMYLYGQIPLGLQAKLVRLQGIRFFASSALGLSFEKDMERHGLPITKALRGLMLDTVTDNFRYHPSAFLWAALIFRLYGPDNLMTMLRDHRHFFLSHCPFLLDSDHFGFMIEFLKGVDFKQFKKNIEHSITTNDLARSIFPDEVKRNNFRKNFALDPNDKSKPYFWDFTRRHKIKFGDVFHLLSLEGKIDEMMRPLRVDIPILYDKDDLKFRAPENPFELFSWGKALSNCLYDKLKYIDKRYGHYNHIFGIFHKHRLIGAVQLSETFRIVEMQAFAGNDFKDFKRADLEKIVKDAAKKLNPVFQIYQVLSEKFDRILMNVLDGKLKKSEVKDLYKKRVEDVNQIIGQQMETMRKDLALTDERFAEVQALRPQIWKRYLLDAEERNVKIPDALRVLLVGSKRQPAKRGTPRQSHSQP